MINRLVKSSSYGVAIVALPLFLLSGLGAVTEASIPPQDSVVIPDGTPLTLVLEESMASSTAKIGDPVEFMTAHPVRIEGLVVVPEATGLTGTVVQVAHPHRGAKDGQVKVMIEKLILPSGEVATLRLDKSKDKKTKGRAMRAKAGPGFETTDPTLDALVLLTVPVWAPAMLLRKGHESVYEPGTEQTVYFNGPLLVNRAALAALQPTPYEPPPYEGPAELFFVNNGNRIRDVRLYCGREVAVQGFDFLRMDLNPGTYSFSTDEAKDQAVQIEVQKDHQYWITRSRRGLFVEDFKQHEGEIEKLEGVRRASSLDFVLPGHAGTCLPITHP